MTKPLNLSSKIPEQAARAAFPEAEFVTTHDAGADTPFASLASTTPGSLGGGPGKPALYCCVIIKRVDERTRAKTSINELLRD